LLATDLWSSGVLGSVDLNLPGLEYVAAHLKKRDCRNVEAALHDPKFDHVNNTDAACTNCEILSILQTKLFRSYAQSTDYYFFLCLLILYSSLTSNLDYACCFSFSYHH
jgi:hypothetical protein